MNILIFTILVTVCDGFRILCLLPYPGKSHYMVFEPLLQELTARGHHLTVVSFFPLSTPQQNRRDVSLVGLAPLNVEVVDLKDFEPSYFNVGGLSKQFALTSNLALSSVRLCEKLLHSDVFEEFVQTKGQYDVILLEYFQSDCMLGLVHNYGLPSVGLMSCTMLPWTPQRLGAPANSAFFPNHMLPVTDEMTFWEMVLNAFYNHFTNIWYDYMIRIAEQKILENRLGRRLPLLSEVAKNTSVVLVNTHHSWNGIKVTPPSLVEVGGLHLHNKTVKQLPEQLEKWANEAQHGFIVFSFGSLIRGSSLPLNRLDALLKAFARLKQRVIWKWEFENIQDLPVNVMIVKWLPQYDLLHHRKCVALITHGGMLSLTEAVAAAVPALVVPVLGDQFGNAAHARRAGFAQVLALHDIQEDNIYNALQKVLSPEMRARARAVSEQWWDRPLSAMATAVYEVERVARHGGLNLSSHARHLSALQMAAFDALGLLVIITAISLLIIIIFSCICCKRSHLKVKQC